MVSPVRFQIGDFAWIARFHAVVASVTCPDCGGTGRLRVIFHDETEVSIACANCSDGYDAPTGRVRTYDRSACAEKVHINGFEVGPSKTRYRLGYSDNCYQVANDCDLFETEGDALVRAAELAKAAEAEELQRIARKEKDARSWAWNASYHRREIKEFERRIVYHKAKLAVAAIKAKEPVPA